MRMRNEEDSRRRRKAHRKGMRGRILWKKRRRKPHKSGKKITGADERQRREMGKEGEKGSS